FAELYPDSPTDPFLKAIDDADGEPEVVHGWRVGTYLDDGANFQGLLEEESQATLGAVDDPAADRFAAVFVANVNRHRVASAPWMTPPFGLVARSQAEAGERSRWCRRPGLARHGPRECFLTLELQHLVVDGWGRLELHNGQAWCGILAEWRQPASTRR